MLDQRKSEIWKALGIGPQWIERDELAKAAEEAVKAKAEAAVEALAQMTAPQTSVLRDDKVMRINTADVVPGDIIVLAEGDSVSADGRLVNAASLRIAEASLTGESVPVGKKPDTLTEARRWATAPT